jgi:hypothetical protein
MMGSLLFFRKSQLRHPSSKFDQCQFSVDNIAKLLRRTWRIDDRRQVFMSLSLEKDLSSDATVTGMVQSILRATQ